jgi:hypothetical protein
MRVLARFFQFWQVLAKLALPELKKSGKYSHISREWPKQVWQVLSKFVEFDNFCKSAEGRVDCCINKNISFCT